MAEKWTDKADKRASFPELYQMRVLHLVDSFGQAPTRSIVFPSAIFLHSDCLTVSGCCLQKKQQDEGIDEQ